MCSLAFLCEACNAWPTTTSSFVSCSLKVGVGALRRDWPPASQVRNHLLVQRRRVCIGSCTRGDTKQHCFGPRGQTVCLAISLGVRGMVAVREQHGAARPIPARAGAATGPHSKPCCNRELGASERGAASHPLPSSDGLCAWVSGGGGGGWGQPTGRPRPRSEEPLLNIFGPGWGRSPTGDRQTSPRPSCRPSVLGVGHAVHCAWQCGSAPCWQQPAHAGATPAALQAVLWPHAPKRWRAPPPFMQSRVAGVSSPRVCELDRQRPRRARASCLFVAKVRLAEIAGQSAAT